MADELQALLDRIDRDGIQRGEAEKEKIVSAAKAEAAAMIAAPRAAPTISAVVTFRAKKSSSKATSSGR